MPVTALDHWIGFHPWALVPYLSLWIYISLPPVLLRDKRALVRYFYAAVGLSLAGMLVYLFWPTATPAPDIDWARHPGFDWLQSVGLARNACPSLHAAFAVFSALWLVRLLRDIRAPAALRAVNVLWALAILYSTMATRQHVALDIYAGGVLGGTVFLIHRLLAKHCLRRLRYHREADGAELGGARTSAAFSGGAGVYEDRASGVESKSLVSESARREVFADSRDRVSARHNGTPIGR